MLWLLLLVTSDWRHTKGDHGTPFPDYLHLCSLRESCAQRDSKAALARGVGGINNDGGHHRPSAIRGRPVFRMQVRVKGITPHVYTLVFDRPVLLAEMALGKQLLPSYLLFRTSLLYCAASEEIEE